MSQQASDKPDAHVRFLDVGHGDCTVVRLAGGEVILVDCNMRAFDDAPPAIECLQRFADDSPRPSPTRYDIDLLCLTHPDRDHYHGMERVLDWVDAHGGRVRNLLMWSAIDTKELIFRAKQYVSEQTEPDATLCATAQYTEFVGLMQRLARVANGIRRTGGTFQRATQFAPLIGWPTATAYVLGPVGARAEPLDAPGPGVVARVLTGGDAGDHTTNERSAILWLVVGDIGVLLPGDATSGAWGEAMEHYERMHTEHAKGRLPATIVKASHHGSRSGSSEAIWAKALSADRGYVVISAGGRYGLPHTETLTHIRTARPGAHVFCTTACTTRRRLILAGTDDASAWLDEHTERAAADGVDRSNIRFRAYPPHHGACQFDIWADGRILVDTEFQPNADCYRHLEGSA